MGAHRAVRGIAPQREADGDVVRIVPPAGVVKNRNGRSCWPVPCARGYDRVMAFVRSVLGDIPPSELGVTHAHEHLVIDPGRPTELFPDFLLEDVDLMAGEVTDAARLGLQAVVDAMPIDAGRNARKLAQISRRTGVHVIAPTGIHHARFYADDHWSTQADEQRTADRFTTEIRDAIDDGPERAGVIKIAGSDGGPSERDRPIFAAAAITQRRTGVPILTHCEGGTGALEQLRLLAGHGADLRHVAVSHVDKLVDRGYHREIASTGAFVELDHAFRWGDQPNGTLTILGWLAEDGLLDQVVLGLDAARRGYLRVYGGRPGLGYLLGEFSRLMAGIGLDETARRALFVDNPARMFAFAEPLEGAA
jgi:predicted metal-dependent phosphotriesterase family hydrolase